MYNHACVCTGLVHVVSWLSCTIYRSGHWSDRGLTTVIEKDSIVCKSTHLTSFAILVDVSGSTNVSGKLYNSVHDFVDMFRIIYNN